MDKMCGWCYSLSQPSLISFFILKGYDDRACLCIHPHAHVCSSSNIRWPDPHRSFEVY